MERKNRGLGAPRRPRSGQLGTGEIDMLYDIAQCVLRNKIVVLKVLVQERLMICLTDSEGDSEGQGQQKQESNSVSSKSQLLLPWVCLSQAWVYQIQSLSHNVTSFHCWFYSNARMGAVNLKMRPESKHPSQVCPALSLHYIQNRTKHPEQPQMPRQRGMTAQPHENLQKEVATGSQTTTVSQLSTVQGSMKKCLQVKNYGTTIIPGLAIPSACILCASSLSCGSLTMFTDILSVQTWDTWRGIKLDSSES